MVLQLYGLAAVTLHAHMFNTVQQSYDSVRQLSGATDTTYNQHAVCKKTEDVMPYIHILSKDLKKTAFTSPLQFYGILTNYSAVAYG